MEESRKRRRTRYENRGPGSRPVLEINEEGSEEVQELEDPWVGMSFFALDEPATQMMPTGWQQNSESWDYPMWDNDLGFSLDFDFNGARFNEASEFLSQELPELFSSVPSLQERFVDLSISNPFAEGGVKRHPGLRSSSFKPPEDGAVDGYIKFRMRMSDVEERSRGKNSERMSFGRQRLRLPQKMLLPNPTPGSEVTVPYLPPDFGLDQKLNNLDRKLHLFYRTAYCKGRTLLSETNFWINDIAPIANGDACTKHALLALSGSYVLDYLPDKKLLDCTNQHYRKATELISQKLKSKETHDIDKGDSVVSAILLLIVDDCITWELRKPKDIMPNWYLGAQLARSILDNTDPGYRYWKAQNVQCTSARLANANWAAFACILAQPVIPLKFEDTRRTFSWLLQGTERDVRKIHGGTGLCPKLLHTFSQITSLTARLIKSPDSKVIPLGASRIEKRLENFYQWSEASMVCRPVEELFASCVLDSSGKVESIREVTELTGQAWVAATQIYLHCRFFRKPRANREVQSALSVLIQCVRMMPTTGRLFSSQAPFFPIFLMALVSYKEDDLAVVSDWFNTIVSGAGCRSSVPPVWKVIQSTWEWMGRELAVEDYDEQSPIGERRPWWEEMVEWLMETHGWVSLT